MSATLPSADQLMEEARAITGISIHDPAIIEALNVLVSAFNGEGQLHAAGARGMHGKLSRILANRLRMLRDFSAHPEIHDEAITAPVFICGMGRTGSSKLQKLMAASGDFNWLPYWQVTFPSLISGDPTESPQPRIDGTEAFVRWFDAASPETRAGHPMATHEPEEESFILEHSLMTPCFMGWAPLPGYLGWLTGADMRAQFALLRDMLKYLQWQGLAKRGKPWLLKSPLYSGMEPMLLEAFPDARLVMTHRHPVDTMPSGLKLLECFYKPFSDAKPDPAGYVAGQAFAINQHLDLRPDLDFCDVGFPEVTGSATALAQRIWQWLKIPLSPKSLARMEGWTAANPQGKNGRHAYALADYGLTRDCIADDFARYIAFLERLPARTAQP